MQTANIWVGYPKLHVSTLSCQMRDLLVTYLSEPDSSLESTALLKVDFGGRSHCRVPKLYLTVVKKSI